MTVGEGESARAVMIRPRQIDELILRRLVWPPGHARREVADVDAVFAHVEEDEQAGRPGIEQIALLAINAVVAENASWTPRPGADPTEPEGRRGEWTVAAGLTLHPKKTRIVDAQVEGVDFLGWHFRGSKKWPRKKTLQKLQDKLRPLTKRTNGRSLSDIVAKANPILRGWHGYFRESHPNGLRGPDGWLRRRLRAMLRKREKRPGYGLSKADSRKWPNRWFAAHGLFSLEHGSCAYG